MKIAVTTGDPAGVGPDIVLSLARYRGDAELCVLGDREVLAQRAQQLGEDVAGAKRLVERLNVMHIPVDAPVRAGAPDPRNAAHVLRQLDAAADGCARGEFDAVATAPVAKDVVCAAGVQFVGHTDYFGERCGAQAVMLFVADDLRVALLTAHLPLREVADAVSVERTTTTARTLDAALRKFFGVASPRITVCGLNPHAGENGALGDEERTVLAPAVAQLRESGMDVRGPVPADTAFIPAKLGDSDAYIGMYHDQVLPLIKHLAFDSAVNVTLGLPFVRTSVDHGTAFELAGGGRADSANMHAAVGLAESLVTTQLATTVTAGRDD